MRLVVLAMLASILFMGTGCEIVEGITSGEFTQLADDFKKLKKEGEVLKKKVDDGTATITELDDFKDKVLVFVEDAKIKMAESGTPWYVFLVQTIVTIGLAYFGINIKRGPSHKGIPTTIEEIAEGLPKRRR